jgi:hypothetical protein
MVCTMQSSGGGFDKNVSIRASPPHTNPHKIIDFFGFLLVKARIIIFSCDEIHSSPFIISNSGIQIS